MRVIARILIEIYLINLLHTRGYVEYTLRPLHTRMILKSDTVDSNNYLV